MARAEHVGFDRLDLVDVGVLGLTAHRVYAVATRTQQQLGIQSLSIANSNSENILQLFR